MDSSESWQQVAIDQKSNKIIQKYYFIIDYLILNVNNQAILQTKLN